MILSAENRDRKWWSALFLGVVFLLFPIAEKPIFGLPVYPSEVALILAIGFGGTYLIKEWYESLGEDRSKMAIFSWLTAIFLMGIGISFAGNTPTFSDLGKLKSFYILPVLLALSIPVLLKDPMKLRLVFQGWVFGILAASLAALVSALEGWFLYDGRLAGPYTSANYLAALLAPGAILSIYFFSTAQRVIMKWLLGFGLFIIGIVLFLTHSYATWFALSISLLFGAILFFKTTAGIKWRFFVLPIILLIGILLTEMGTEKWSQLISADPRSSFASRQIIWGVALNIATDHPWIGIGMANFQDKYLEYQKYYPPYLEWAVPTPHNLSLHFWLEGGIIALAAWLGILLLLVRYVWLSVKTEISIEKRLSIALSATLVLFYVLYGIVDTPYMKNDLVFAVWGSIGLLVASLRLKG